MVTLLDWVISPDTNTLKHVVTGNEVNLSPRSMDVLKYLIDSDGKLVTSSELLAEFWSKSSASDHAVHNAIADLRSALGDQASNPRYIKTYAKRGYVLLAEPAVGPSEAETNEEASSRLQFPAMSQRWKYGALGVVLSLLVMLLGFALNNAISLGEPRVIYITPFANNNVHAANQFWAEQLPASLVSHLSKIENINVVSGTGNYLSDGGARIADSGVADYLLTGNIQQENSRLRLQIDLVDARDFSTVISDQFDITSDDVFQVHDEVGASIAAALSIYLDEEQQQDMRNWGTASPVAYSMFLKANFHANQSNHEDMEIALDNYFSATQEDRNFLNAYLGLARTASSLGMYSHESRNIQLREILQDTLREVTRIAPEDDSILLVRDISLRIEGTNKDLIEKTLKNLILDGDPPEFVYARYGSLLMEARLYYEAEQFFALTGEAVPFDLLSETNGISQTFLSPPEELIQIQKANLLERPAHIAVLNGLIRGLIFSGDHRQAKFYLERLMGIDAEGPFSMLSQVTISSLWGSSTEAGDAFERLNSSNPDYHLSHGAKSLIAGDVGAGVRYWRSLSNADLRRLSTMLYKIELFFPEEVLVDPAYQALLEELNLGISWQRSLMQSVMEMAAVTGVDLHNDSQIAYDNNVFLMNNNLWNHEEINYPNRDSAAELNGIGGY